MAKPKLEQKAKVGGLPNREEFYSQQGQRAQLNKIKKRRRRKQDDRPRRDDGE